MGAVEVERVSLARRERRRLDGEGGVSGRSVDQGVMVAVDCLWGASDGQRERVSSSESLKRWCVGYGVAEPADIRVGLFIWAQVSRQVSQQQQFVCSCAARSRVFVCVFEGNASDR